MQSSVKTNFLHNYLIQYLVFYITLSNLIAEYVCQNTLEGDQHGDKNSQMMAKKNLLRVITKSACDFLRETRTKYQVSHIIERVTCINMISAHDALILT